MPALGFRQKLRPMIDRLRYQVMHPLPLAPYRVVGLLLSESVVLSVPTFIDFLPHLYTVSGSALRPALTYGNDSLRLSKTDFVIGIPTVARHNQSYLLPTLQSLIGGLSSEEMKMVTIVVLIADDAGPYSPFVKEQCDSLQSEFPSELNSGLLRIIVPPREWYSPDLYTLPATFNDSPERMRWRTKQNLDYMFLMLYCQRRGEYYLQLEDDVISKAGFIKRVKEFIAENEAEDWLMLEFSSLGFIGKLFRSSDLTLLTQFIALFYQVKPVDWLLDLLFVTKLHRIRCRPSIFQHIGVHSSLAGKVQKLRERDFGKAQLFIPHRDNPPAKITTSLKTYMLYDLESAYGGENYYWALSPVANDYILFEFYSIINLIGFVVRTGNPEHPSDILNGSAEVLLKKQYEPKPVPVAQFSERGTVRISFNQPVK
ncbi:unnamed protein product, partial [Gongylonema pulchrum]|uniref:Alpha-1,3-mannosyl-glycoprotein 4-beta-N-acetylglucosaminyltransferase A n=1 Tax=Gongylonema pulchrum TaxID=637853 RepID=A0A183DRT8_9BILA